MYSTAAAMSSSYRSERVTATETQSLLQSHVNGSTVGLNPVGNSNSLTVSICITNCACIYSYALLILSVDSWPMFGVGNHDWTILPALLHYCVSDRNCLATDTFTNCLYSSMKLPPFISFVSASVHSY